MLILNFAMNWGELDFVIRSNHFKPIYRLAITFGRLICLAGVACMTFFIKG